MLESLSSVFADISVPQLALITAMALIASVVGGVAGYGTEMSAKTEDSDSSIGPKSYTAQVLYQAAFGAHRSAAG